MTDSLPDPALDELIAAYLDGEATADERARVQGDPVLSARAEQLRAVSNLVAEPVVMPDAALREAHIAAALEASSTSPVVTSLAARRNRGDMVRLLSIAAVVLAAIVAVPLLVSTNRGNDADSAATATSADDGLAAMDAAAGDDGAAEEASDDAGAAEMSADESAPRSAPGEADDDTAADDTSDGEGDGTGDAAADDGAAVAEAAPADDGGTGAEGGVAADTGTGIGAVRIDLDPVVSTRAIARQLDERFDAEATAPVAGDALDGLMCGAVIADEIARTGPAATVGRTVFDGTPSEYLRVVDPIPIIVVFDVATCTPLARG